MRPRSPRTSAGRSRVPGAVAVPGMRVPGGACRSGVGVVLDGSDIGACWSGAIPALVQHISSTSPAPRQHAAPSELLERVGSASTPLQHHANTTSTRLRVTLGAAHTTSPDPKVKIRSGRPPKTRFQAGFAISTGFRKLTREFWGRFSFDSRRFRRASAGSQSSELLERVGRVPGPCWSGAVPALVQHAPVLC